MDFNAIDVFCRVVSLGGVGAAARELKVSQSAVSQRLRALERDLGKRLYGRAENRLVLTEEGRRLLNACRPGVDALRSAETLMRAAETQLRGRIRLVALREFAKVFLLQKIQDFSARHPAVTFSLTYASPADLPSLLLRGEADLTFSYEAPGRAQVEAFAGFTEDYVLVGPPPARRFAWSDLADVPFLRARTQDNAWFEFMETLSRHGVKLRPPMLEISDIESRLRLAANGAGYTLAPVHSVRLRRLTGLVVHELPRWKNKEAIYFCRLRSVPMGPALEAFWNLLRTPQSEGLSRRKAR